MGFWPLVKKVIKDADIILYILDARMPELSYNMDVEYLAQRHGKPIIKVFNKIDLISKADLNALRKKKPDAVFVSGVKNIGMRFIRKAVFIEAKKLGIANPMVGIVGYPNMGKSAIINALSKRSKAMVSRIAGTTKAIQWVKAGTIKVIDSPGIIPFEDGEKKLGVLGAKNPEKLRKPERVVNEIIKMLRETKPEALEKFYGIEISSEEDEYEIMLKIGRARGYLVKGGEVDENRTMYQIIRDWQSGKLGL
jgi:ribosome biogenesis GTPase A